MRWKQLENAFYIRWVQRMKLCIYQYKLLNRLGFHQRPWHSIGHLHLHCIELPFRGCFAKFTHRYPFFVTSERVHKWID